MGDSTGRLSGWTRYFTVASAFTLVVVQAVILLGGHRHLVALLAVFGFICPMIFGMAYLLLPSYVGRTLVHQRLPSLHFVLAYVGTGLLLVYRLVTSDNRVLIVGIIAWSLGVAVFVGELLWTIIPAVLDRPEIVLRTEELPQRSTRLATAMIPVAISYLVIGTLALLERIPGIPAVLPAAFPNVIHYYATGFGAVLIFALGARLMPGFFHVTPPRWATWIVLVTGGVGPALLGTYLWGGLWFRVGAVLEAIAMGGYGLIVGYVYWQSDWQRIGFYGVLLGAIAGTVAVGLGFMIAFTGVTPARLTTHVTVILSGFFALTIIGYAYQFFPVTTGQFLGASDRTALATIGGIAIGVFYRGLVSSGLFHPLRRLAPWWCFSVPAGTGISQGDDSSVHDQRCSKVPYRDYLS